MKTTAQDIRTAKTGYHWIRWTPAHDIEAVRVARVRAGAVWVVSDTNPARPAIRLNDTVSAQVLRGERRTNG